MTLLCTLILNTPTHHGHKTVFQCGKEMVMPLNSKDLKHLKLGEYEVVFDREKKFVFKINKRGSDG